MRRATCTILLAFLLLAAVGATGAGAAPGLSPQDRKAIGLLLDRFVKDAVLRENLPDAWRLIGPDMRGGTTRRAWNDGTGVTVAAFPARGRDFRDAWTVTKVVGDTAQLSMMLHPKPGTHDVQTAFSITVEKVRGRWLVDIFYPAAEFGPSGISGPNDFKAASGGSSYGNASSRIAGRWLIVGLGGFGGVLLLVLAGVWLHVRRRDRRAWDFYLGSR